MSIQLPKPFASAHRAGNSRKLAISAIEAGADLLETDIWLHKGRLEIRHKHRLGSLPILWEKWSIALDFRRYTLRDLLHDVPDTTVLFLDFKGWDMDLGPAVLNELNATAPDRVVATCGRNYPQLQTIADNPNILTFYSVGTEAEWPVAQPLIEASSHPALSLIASMATPERIDWMNSIGGTVVCWDVKSIEQMEYLRNLGVDGFTTDNTGLLGHIRDIRRSFSGV